MERVYLEGKNLDSDKMRMTCWPTIVLPETHSIFTESDLFGTNTEVTRIKSYNFQVDKMMLEGFSNGEQAKDSNPALRLIC